MTWIAILSFAKRYWPLLAGAGMLIAFALLVHLLTRAQDHAVTQAKDAGAAEQRATDLTETVNRTMEANNAAEAVRRDPDARHAQCVRYARNPNDCD